MDLRRQLVESVRPEFSLPNLACKNNLNAVSQLYTHKSCQRNK